MGCTKSAKECGRSHNPMKGKFADLHWTVQAQLLRRGGIKSGPAIALGAIDDRISVLRAAAKAADAAAKDEGAKASGGRRGGSTWSPPAEFRDVALTAAEHELADLVKGPDPRWGCEAHPGGLPSDAVVRVPEEHQEYAKRLEEWTPAATLEGASESLQAYVRSRQAQDLTATAETALAELATFGVGEIAEEAGIILDASTKAGHTVPAAEVYLGAVIWPADGSEPGRASSSCWVSNGAASTTARNCRCRRTWRPSWVSRSLGQKSASDF